MINAPFGRAFRPPAGPGLSGSVWPANYLVYDTFTGADGTLLTAHTPDCDVLRGGWNNSVYTMELLSNVVVKTAGASYAACYLDCGTPDVTISGDVVLDGHVYNTTVAVYLIARYTDVKNYWHLVLSYYNSTLVYQQLRLTEITSGTITLRASTTTPIVLGKSYALKYVLSGNSHACYIDNVLKLSYSSTVHNTATKYGIGIGNYGDPNSKKITVDNFLVTTP